MTLYTYLCPNCGEFQEFRDNNDREKCKCGLNVKKTFGMSFSLKGNGFYSNDSKRDDAIKAETI